MATTTPFDTSRIPGWGADLDRARRPAVPMERTPPRLEGLHWDQPGRQASSVEVLRSIERPAITPVYGTSCPPRGLSGWLRRRAFRRSEGDMRHWLMLLFADRVDVAESAFRDVRHSRKAQAVAIVGVGLLAAWWLRRR